MIVMSSVMLTMLFSLLLLTLMCNAYAETYNCQNCNITITQSQSSISSQQQVAQSQQQQSSPFDWVVSKIDQYVKKLISNADINDPNTGVTSDKLNKVESSWFDTLKKGLGFGETLNNATTTTINEFSPVKLSTTVLWILGLIITGWILFSIMRKFWKHAMFFIILVVLVIVFLVVMGIHSSTPY